MKTILKLIVWSWVVTAPFAIAEGDPENEPKGAAYGIYKIEPTEDVRGSYIRLGTLLIDGSQPQRGIEFHKDHWIFTDEMDVHAQLDIAGYHGQAFKFNLALSLENHIRAQIEADRLNSVDRGPNYHYTFSASFGYVDFTPEEENEIDFAEYHACALLFESRNGFDTGTYAGLDLGAMKSFGEGEVVLKALAKGGLLYAADPGNNPSPTQAKLLLSVDWNPTGCLSIGGEYAIIRLNDDKSFQYGKIGVGVGF